MSQSREVFVLSAFREHAKGEVFQVAYETDRQRQAVNELIHRGFLTFEVETARQYFEAEQDEPDPKAPEDEKTPPRRTRSKKS